MSARILYLSADRGIPVRSHKGAAVHIRMMCQALSELGHQVTLLTPKAGPADGQPVAAVVRQVDLPMEQELSAEAQAIAYTDRLYEAAAAYLAENPVDFIYERYSLWSDVGGRLSQAFGLPLVLEFNAPLVEEAARYRSLEQDGHARQVERRQLEEAAVVAVVSDQLAAYVVAHGTRPEAVAVLPNGVDPKLFHPAVRGGKVRRRYGLEGKYVLGFSGRMRPWHDGPTLLGAFRQLFETDRRYRLLLVGQMSDEIASTIDDLGLGNLVIQTGPIPHAEVPAHLAAMDVALSTHAPLADFYFSPLKLFEYMACAVPTVAAAIGQPGRMIAPGRNGYLYEPGDAVSLAEQIIYVRTHSAEATAAAWQGAELVHRHHTWTENARHILRLVGQDDGREGQQPAAEEVRPHLPLIDSRLKRRLYRATRPDLALKPLSWALTGHSEALQGRIKQIHEIEILKYKPRRRCVMRYRLDGRGEADERRQWSVIGKIFRDERGRRLDALQTLLWQAGFDEQAADQIVVAEPLGYVPSMHMQLQGDAPGQTLNELGKVQPLAPLMARCAAALAKLHRPLTAYPLADLQINDVTLKHYALGDELEQLAVFKAGLDKMWPSHQPRIAAMYHNLVSLADTLSAPPAEVLIHRDFYYSQLLLHLDRVTLIDFDLLSLGDPALDVANFTAHLVYLGLELFGDRAHFEEAVTAFWHTYRLTLSDDPTFEARLAFYKAATYFRLQHVISTRPALQPLLLPLMAEVDALLEPVGVQG